MLKIVCTGNTATPAEGRLACTGCEDSRHAVSRSPAGPRARLWDLKQWTRDPSQFHTSAAGANPCFRMCTLHNSGQILPEGLYEPKWKHPLTPGQRLTFAEFPASHVPFTLQELRGRAEGGSSGLAQNRLKKSQNHGGVRGEAQCGQSPGGAPSLYGESKNSGPQNSDFRICYLFTCWGDIMAVTNLQR